MVQKLADAEGKQAVLEKDNDNLRDQPYVYPASPSMHSSSYADHSSGSSLSACEYCSLASVKRPIRRLARPRR